MSPIPDIDSLIPETPILVYPSIATTLGLEEATMLAQLSAFARTARGLQNNGYTWFNLDESHVRQLMPFWRPIDVQRISTNLREQGLLLIASAPYGRSLQLKFAFNRRGEPHREQPQPEAIQPSFTPPGRTLIAPSWQPDREAYARLAQHNIPQSFARELVPEFVHYWRERGETASSWGAKFMHHALRRWREYEEQQSLASREKPMVRNWRPSEDAMDVLTRHAGISRTFVEDAIPEFELYWRERGDTSDNWNKKFRDHVHRQWLRYRSALEHDTVPRRIPETWQPSEDVYEVLRLANIDIDFAQSLLPEFVIYWRDSNQVHSSWNTRFLQYVKQRWAKRHLHSDNTTKSTRELSLAEQLTDRSWAL